jgi:hypothetical protein
VIHLTKRKFSTKQPKNVKTLKKITLREIFEARLNKRLKNGFLNVCRTSIFSHPDYTVGFGIAPNPALRLAGLEINSSPPVGNFTTPRR